MKSIALHILDLVENSIRAKADRVEISITEETDNDRYILTIEDNGEGMNEEVVKMATDPFYTSRSTRKIGMGLPLIQLNAERTGGNLLIQTNPGKGTTLEACFVLSHTDRLPLGEVDEVLVLLAASLPNIRLIYTHKTDFGIYCFDTEKIRKILGDLQEYNMEIRKFLREMIVENLKKINAEA